jgi:hypothetical protein
MILIGYKVMVFKIYFDLKYRPIVHDVTAPVTMHLEDKLAIYA